MFHLWPIQQKRASLCSNILYCLFSDSSHLEKEASSDILQIIFSTASLYSFHQIIPTWQILTLWSFGGEILWFMSEKSFLSLPLCQKISFPICLLTNHCLLLEANSVKHSSLSFHKCIILVQANIYIS